MTDELPSDPFTRAQVGQHNAFLLRINPKHVERAVEHIRARRLAEVQVEFGDAEPKLVRRVA